MPKAIRGIYENGKIKLPIRELPESEKKLQVIVIFLEADANTQQIEEDMMRGMDVSSFAASEEIRPFSLTNSRFFSLPPEHLGATSASELDEIIAGEALGRK